MSFHVRRVLSRRANSGMGHVGRRFMRCLGQASAVGGCGLVEGVSDLLDATGHLTWGVAGECDDAEGAAYAGCVLGAGQAMAFLLSLEGIQCRDSHPARKSCPRSTGQFLSTVQDLPGTRSTDAGCGMILPASGPRCR